MSYICEKCGKLVELKYGSGRFCSRACANSHVQTAEQNISRANKLQQRSKELKLGNYKKVYKNCSVCGREFLAPIMKNGKVSHRTTCSAECLSKLNSQNGTLAGRISAANRVIRSKNEIAFCELCEAYFNNVEHNKPIFKGWDSDVIIHDIKYAILWNGPRHYKEIMKECSLEQIQNRDKLKLISIQNCGYIPYIIRDDGKYNPDFAQSEFDKFIKFIGY